MAVRLQLNRLSVVEDGRHGVLRIRHSDLQKLASHVFSRYPHYEWGTFFRCGHRRTPWGVVLTYVDPLLPRPGDLDRQSEITEFRDVYSRRAFHGAASGDRLAMCVVHSHPMGARTSPSALDDDMDRYFSHELSSYGGGSPYLSLILQRNDDSGLTFSGRIYDRGEWLPLRWLLTCGEKIERYRTELDTLFAQVPVATVVTAEEPSNARLRSLMGERAALQLRRAVVGVIGCSGTGSPALEVLARAGVGEFILIDPDIFKRSNLERVHGSTEEDASSKTLSLKVEIATRLIRAIDPGINVTAFAGNVLHPNVVDELVRCDLLLGCTDSVHGRLALSDLATHYLLPSLDVGVLMDGSNGRVTEQVIEFNQYSPGTGCAFCGGLINSGRLAAELMTEEERKIREAAAQEAIKRGDDPDQYWHGRPRQLNTVGYLTTAAGGLLAGYAEGLITGTFEMPHLRFQFDPSNPRLGVAVGTRTQDPECSCGHHIGWADQGRAYRHINLPPHWPKRAVLVSRTAVKV